jgi:hypothetical protein
MRCRRRVAQTPVIDHRAHLLRAHRKPLVTSKIVTDPANPTLGVILAMGKDPLFERGALVTYRNRRRSAAQRLDPAFLILTAPLGDRRFHHTYNLANILRG